MTDPNTKIELMAKDIEYIKSELGEIKESLKLAMSQKADRTEVEKLAANQSKIAWMVITAVVIAVLGLVIKSTVI